MSTREGKIAGRKTSLTLYNDHVLAGGTFEKENGRSTSKETAPAFRKQQVVIGEKWLRAKGLRIAVLGV